MANRNKYQSKTNAQMNKCEKDADKLAEEGAQDSGKTSRGR
jgi:hypothetical protein